MIETSPEDLPGAVASQKKEIELENDPQDPWRFELSRLWIP